IVQRAALALGCSVPTAYRQLQAAGFDSNRKRRSDAGRSTLPESELRLVAGMLAASTNKRGQRLPVDTALDMARASGALASTVSASTVLRQLHAKGLHPTQLALPSASIALRSEHPNHVWQVDSTTGAYYYLPEGKLRWMPEDEFYKNKSHNLVKASSDLLTRYCAADHATHAFKVRYYLGGESAENLLDFMVWAMCQQPGGPMHGVPFVLMCDQGAANRSQVFLTFCRRLQVDLRHHAPGAARVTGSVEKAHDLVGMFFERRFRFKDPSQVTLQALNDEVLEWAHDYCARAVHTRHRQTRYGAYMRIQATQLRTVPEAVLREQACREPEQRRVSNDRRVSFDGRSYDLALVPGVVAGLKVTLQMNLYRAPAIDVQYSDPATGELTWHVVEPLREDDFGFPAGAQTIGQGMRTAAHSVHDQARGELAKEAYALPTLQQAEKARRRHAQAYAGVVDPMADVRANPAPAWLPRRGTELGVPGRTLAPVLLGWVDACKRLRPMLGEHYGPHVYQYVAAQWPDGAVPQDQLEAVAERLRPQVQADAAAPLRLVGGGAA
ncbi:MAG: hypothetical protein ACKVQR_18660, partial [Aquabacterium sp.]